jgi:hypothetical protein
MNCKQSAGKGNFDERIFDRAENETATSGRPNAINARLRG